MNRLKKFIIVNLVIFILIILYLLNVFSIWFVSCINIVFDQKYKNESIINGEDDTILNHCLDITLSKVPKKIIDSFESNGWSISLDNKNILDDNIAGITCYTRKHIYISNDYFDIINSTIHEIGHYIDFDNMFISESDEWKRIYSIEKYNANINEYCKSTSQEFFAEMFSQTILFPNKCKKQTPIVYGYMIQLISTY